MTKSEIVAQIVKETGVEKTIVTTVVESFMETAKSTLIAKESIYLRGFGTFAPKFRAQKVARNISKNTAITIPSHYIAHFKPSKGFCDKIKQQIKENL